MSWRLEFGAGGFHPGYALALGYRATDPALPAGELLAIDVSDRAALARLAGVPLLGRSYRAEQTEGDALPSATAAKPWYARPWVLWTAAGVASSLVLAGGGGSDESTSGSCTGDCADSDPGTDVLSGTVNGPGGTEVCVLRGGPTDADVCADAFVGSAAGAASALAFSGSPDAGTGGMGDLFLR